MRAPAFWTHDGWLSRGLSIFSPIAAAVTGHRVARPGWRAPVPVICCGNATVGGAGKTTLTLDLVRRLTARGIAVHILTRGYGGASQSPRRVTSGDTAESTGDEAQLLATAAPTWIGADRAVTARAAIKAGAEVLVMDDGLQNPSLSKTMSLLVVDGRTGFGNGRVLPAGPLREPPERAAARCAAVVLIGPDTTGALARIPAGLPVLRADLAQGPEIAALAGRRAIAFTAIAIPDKFFLGLKRAGVLLVGSESFGDHHRFTAVELARLEGISRLMDAILVTTPKDAVKLPTGMNVKIIDVHISWAGETAIESLLDRLMSGSSVPVAGRSKAVSTTLMNDR
ncbi:MAG: tetraacyldisaccharide 4'-kinase [Acetobacteraceae bacterium]|nr:tetraacyldisaccharide 4'-kinase [Acetobacteraceae bacterium]